MTRTEYRFVGAHADNLDDGRALEPLQKVSLDADAVKGKHASRLISEGLLLEIQPAKAATAAKEGGDK